MKKNKDEKSIVRSVGNKPSRPVNKKISRATKKLKSKKTIGILEKYLLNMLPAETACEWDQTGLLLGNPEDKIEKIAVCLDPTVQVVKFAASQGCNLLLTHHPAYIKGVTDFLPGNSVANHNGALIYEAVKNNVALMNFHTALDVSEQGAAVLPKLLNLQIKKVLCPTDEQIQSKSKLGFGRVCVPKVSEKGITLKQLAARCKSVFGRAPKVWGDFSSKLAAIATNTGSCGSLDDENGVLNQCIRQNIDCLITGEIRYHDALSLSQAGICILEISHDLSEIPLCGVLVNILREFGIKKQDICYIDQSNNWSYQESTLI